MTQIKICGLTRPEDAAPRRPSWARTCSGMVFAAASPRRLDLARAVEIARASEGAVRVGVFRHEPLAESPLPSTEPGSRSSSSRGPSPRRTCARCRSRSSRRSVAPATRSHSRARCSPGSARSSSTTARARGGGPAGRRLKSAERPRLPVDLFVAGGLEGHASATPIRRLRPDGVDVATGVESSPGRQGPRAHGALHRSGEGGRPCRALDLRGPRVAATSAPTAAVSPPRR